jgi:eukaryotic-like serine/threonine-protein kinase
VNPPASPAATPASPASALPGSSNGPPLSSASGGYGALPAGYYRFTNSTGFSIGVPDGWRISHVGHYVYITDPSDGDIFLLIDQSADWEFTYVRDGILVHILSRNVLANAHHAYALYWSTPESDWNVYYRYFQAFADTFRPAQ